MCYCYNENYVDFEKLIFYKLRFIYSYYFVIIQLPKNVFLLIYTVYN